MEMCFIQHMNNFTSRPTLKLTYTLLNGKLSNTGFYLALYFTCRSQWSRGIRRRSSAARLLRLWVRIPPGAWMFVCCECCVLSGRGLCDWLITRPEESYRLWRVVVCDQETSKTRRLKPATGLWKIQPQGCNAKKTTNTSKRQSKQHRILLSTLLYFKINRRTSKSKMECYNTLSYHSVLRNRE